MSGNSVVQHFLTLRLLPALLLFSLAAERLAAEEADVAGEQGASGLRVILLQDYNTRVVLFGATVLGLASGVTASFTLLRKRALTGDALSHASLPGVGLAFLLAPAMGASPKSLTVLLTGAAISGMIGAATILFIRRLPRLKEDAALGIVLSVFFGAGVAILTVVQRTAEGHAAGLDSFIYGQTAAMTSGDAIVIAVTGLLTIAVLLAARRPLTLLCFDEGFATCRGYSTFLLDLLLMACVVLITMIGLRAVGLILMIALLIIPAAAARFWTESLPRMIVIAALIGGCSGFTGALISALAPGYPSGPVIVLVCGLLFFLSFLGGTSRGVLIRSVRRRRLNDSIDREHLLRGIWELREGDACGVSEPPSPAAGAEELLKIRSWSVSLLSRQILRAAREGLVFQRSDGAVVLTERGRIVAERLVQNHRLWELYLITHADVAAGRVDREADAIEHVLEPELIERLKKLLYSRSASPGIPSSPHPLESAIPVVSEEFDAAEGGA